MKENGQVSLSTAMGYKPGQMAQSMRGSGKQAKLMAEEK